MQNFSKAGINSAVAGVEAASGRHTTRKLVHSALLLMALPLLAGMALSASAAETNPLSAKVKDANERFADVAVATSEGYAPIPCVSGTDGGAMGIHYVNQKLLEDPAIAIDHPEAVLYEPGADGKLTLVAVEYITPKGPAALGGQLFSFTNAPNRYGLPAFYELHVWAWKANATGPFADMNPDVSCAAVMDGM